MVKIESLKSYRLSNESIAVIEGEAYISMVEPEEALEIIIQDWLEIKTDGDTYVDCYRSNLMTLGSKIEQVDGLTNEVIRKLKLASL